MRIFKSKWFLIAIALIAGAMMSDQIKPHVDKLLAGFKKGNN